MDNKEPPKPSWCHEKIGGLYLLLAWQCVDDDPKCLEMNRDLFKSQQACMYWLDWKRAQR